MKLWSHGPWPSLAPIGQVKKLPGLRNHGCSQTTARSLVEALEEEEALAPSFGVFRTISYFHCEVLDLIFESFKFLILKTTGLVGCGVPTRM